MAVGMGHEPVESFEQWYTTYEVDERDGCLNTRGVGECGQRLWWRWTVAKREMDMRVQNYHKLEKIGDAEVITEKPDLPNVSSGETSGIVLRTARNVVQNTPNVEIISKFDDDSLEGIISRYVLTSKIIGSDEYSNDMQQNLFASFKSAFVLGYQCVVPVLMEDAGGSWSQKYDTIHYRDVFPEPGARDIRQSTEVFIRRYLTEGEVRRIIAMEPMGWDVAALRDLLKNNPPPREEQSVDHRTKKSGQIPVGYEIITWYSSTGEPFLTFSANTKLLLRIEKNKHPLKEHPIHFLILEKDENQPLGKSQVERLIGRQDFQDLMLNGAMKLWYRNINPSIIGYGTVNSIPNLSPGKYTQIPNPNAKVEAFEVNTGTLMQYGAISQQNLGSMVNLVGSADQQMAQQAGNGMSATPQGVEAQTAMVDITTNNYQKAVESFFSHYCSYALTMYFQEMKSVKAIRPTAEARLRLLKGGLDPKYISEDGVIEVDFEGMATEYWVRCVPGSLVELEDEKQMRLLNSLFVPLSQAMPALAAAQDPEALAHASMAMRYIIEKQIELSGSGDRLNILQLLKNGDVKQVNQRDEKIAQLEMASGALGEQLDTELDLNAAAIVQLQEQVSAQSQLLTQLLSKLGVSNEEPANTQQGSQGVPVDAGATPPNVLPASA